MIRRHHQVLTAHSEPARVFQHPSHCQALTLNWCISQFSISQEAQSCQRDAPAIWAAGGRVPSHEPQPVSDALAVKVRLQAGGELRVKDLDPILDGLNDGLLRLLEQCVQVRGPLEPWPWAQQATEWGQKCRQLAVVGYLVHESEPGAHVGDVTGLGKILDGREMLWEWFYLKVCYPERELEFVWVENPVPLGNLVGSVGWGRRTQPWGTRGPQIAKLWQHPLFVGKTGGWPSTVPWLCGWGRACPLRVICTPLLTIPGGCPCHPFPGASGRWCQEAESLHYSRPVGSTGQGQDLSSTAPFATVCIGPWGRIEPPCRRCTRSKYVMPTVQVCWCAHKWLHQLSHGGRVWAAAVILGRTSRGFHRISCCRRLGAYPSTRCCWCRQSLRKHLLGSLQLHCLMPDPWRPIGLGALVLWLWSSRYTICSLLVCQTYFGRTWAWSCRILCTWSWCLVGHCLWGVWLGMMRWLTPSEFRPWGPGLCAFWFQSWRWFRVGSCCQYLTPNTSRAMSEDDSPESITHLMISSV